VAKKLVDLQLLGTIRQMGFHAESLPVALRLVAAYLDELNATDDWDTYKKVYDVVVSFDVSDDDELDEAWTVTLYVDSSPTAKEKQKEIENERNFLLRRIAELENKLGLNPWWLEDSE
jgi:hypothetical protein